MEKPGNYLDLACRDAENNHKVNLFKAIEPAHAVYVISKCRERLLDALEAAEGVDVATISNSLARIVEIGGRFYGLPSAPKGTAAKPGDNARPVLPMES